ncbi:protease complex subunit PrcB family protein [Flavobacterium ardleyense]|uniref:Protease complex subunit PrcB family protein n=1 Tax=Flavobacterium ardleyense TaxID=2038737 RepID=A0ABW5Z9C9_9FLAO
MFKIIPFFLVLVLSCSTPKSATLKTSFQTIYTSAYGGEDRSGSLHITTNEDFIKLIEKLKIDESEFNTLATIDFKENDIVVLYQGQKMSGGYAIDVESVSWENDILIIKKAEKSPAKGAMVTMALTSPYCITSIPKTKEIKIIQ